MIFNNRVVSKFSFTLWFKIIFMVIREATSADIPQMMEVRYSVRENVLSNRSLVTDADNEDYINRRGKGWVAEADGKIVGFAIADLQDESIWALFIHPDHEKKGIGKNLHNQMMDWYFSTGKEKVWLSTSPETRAETFYKMNGWKESGMKGNEILFTMTSSDWINKKTIP